MSEGNHAGHSEEHPHPNYLAVAAILLVLTISSFFISEQLESKVASVLLVMCLASIKATIVAMFFMHAKFEGKWLYAMLIPTVILAAVVVCALLPDVGRLGQ